jgi:hypothetical protein
MFAETNRMVVRPVLVTKSEYIYHLRRIKDWVGSNIEVKWIHILDEVLQDAYYWLVELSVPELFSANKRKVAEVLLHAEVAYSSHRDFKSFAMARLPEQFCFYVDGGPIAPEYDFYPTGIHGHVELFGCEDQT